MQTYILLGAIAVLVIAEGIFLWKRFAWRKNLQKLFSLRLISVELPRAPEAKDQASALSEINRTSQLLSALLNIKLPFVLEVGVAHTSTEIGFYLAVPESAVQFAMRQVHGLWPEAHVKEADEYSVFHAGSTTRGAYLKEKRSSVLPIRTYIEAELDTFEGILSNFANIEMVGEGMGIQIIAIPASSSAKARVADVLKELKKGASLEKALYGKGSTKGMSDVLSTISGTHNSAEKKDNTPLVVDDEAVKAITTKVNKPLFDVNIRLVASGDTPLIADRLLEGLVNSFSQFGAPLRNEFKAVLPRNQKSFLFKYTMRSYDAAEVMTLNADEIASIFHLPSATTKTPKVRWLSAREAAPPNMMPDEGTSIGISSFRGEHYKVSITDDDRRRHVYLIGQTGTGKSTLMTNMVREDIQKGKGVCIIDPHGDLIETILSNIPKNRVEDVLVFDPSDRERTLGLNMLEFNPAKPEEKTFIVNELFSILDKLYDMKTVGGPMFEQYTKNAILLLMEDSANEPATLMEIPRVFTDPEFRKRKLDRITNPTVVDFWQKEATKATGENSLANMAPYITSKFNNFISNDYVRPIIGQPHSALNFREIMDNKKILLVNLSKGRIGDINAGLLGMVIVGKILMAALSRVDIRDSSARTDFNLYIDEFQNFTTDSIGTILSEARKYGLNLTMAHQFIGQLTEKIRDAVFGNVGSLICFRVGADDAEFLEKQFAPVFSKSDLVNIANFHAYAKLLIRGTTTQPFSLETLPGVRGNQAISEAVKKVSRLRFGRDLKEIETDIMTRLRR